MKLSIVILCWNDLKVIDGCLRSIYAETQAIDFEVIVSDNGSSDGSIEFIRQNYPRARVLENGCNLGFAKGNNPAASSHSMTSRHPPPGPASDRTRRARPGPGARWGSRSPYDVNARGSAQSIPTSSRLPGLGELQRSAGEQGGAQGGGVHLIDARPRPEVHLGRAAVEAGHSVGPQPVVQVRVVAGADEGLRIAPRDLSVAAAAAAAAAAANVRSGPATTSTTSRSAATSTAPGARRRRAAAAGRDVADSAGGGMHAVMAILAALVRRAATGEGAYLDVSVADGVLALMALTSTSTSRPARAGPAATTSSPAATPVTTSTGAPTAVARGRRDRAAVLGEPVPRCSAASTGSTHQTDDDVQDAIRADLRAAFATQDRDDWVAELGPADTCVAPVRRVPEVVDDRALRGARNVFVERARPSDGTSARSAGCSRAWTATQPASDRARRDRHRHRRRCSPTPGFDERRDRRAARGRSRRRDGRPTTCPPTSTR